MLDGDLLNVSSLWRRSTIPSIREAKMRMLRYVSTIQKV